MLLRRAVSRAMGVKLSPPEKAIVFGDKYDRNTRYIGVRAIVDRPWSDMATGHEILGTTVLRRDRVTDKINDGRTFPYDALSEVRHGRLNDPELIADVDCVEVMAGRVRKGVKRTAAFLGILTGAVVANHFMGDNQLLPDLLSQASAFAGLTPETAAAPAESLPALSALAIVNA